jgi:hypothetical protein
MHYPRLPAKLRDVNFCLNSMQPDLDDLRIEERVTEEFMGAAPRAAAVSGVGLRRRPTFRVCLHVDLAAPLHMYHRACSLPNRVCHSRLFNE